MSRLLLLAFCLCCLATTAFAQDVIVINEAIYDSPGTDVLCWAELKGTPGMSLNGYKLVGVNGNGGVEYQGILLDGYTVPADGYFLITQDPANPPGSDLVTASVNYQNGPDSIQLQKNVGGIYQVVDAVGYGTFGGSDIFAGEGSPCLGQGGNANASMARCPDGRDTQNNSTDFIVDVAPTPGAQNAGSCAPVTGACCFLDGSCQVLTQNSCTSQSGTYQGDNVPCEPNPCEVVLPTDLTLCQVSEDNLDGTPVHAGEWVHVHGICTLESNTWAGSRIEFTITDGECCTNVFNGGAATPVIHVGDEVDVIGTVGQFNGKTQVTTPDLTITVVSSGNPIPDPGLVTTGDFFANGENYESCLIEIRCVSIVSGTWPPAGSDATIVVDDGTGPCDLRIDKDTNIDGSAPPTGPFTIIGIASQFDSSNPYTGGYQIMPRSIDDLLFNDCAPPLGACCFPSGLCSELSGADCEAQQGNYLGDGTSCVPNPCGQPEACCFPDGACQLLLADDCTAQGGIPQGPGTICGERVTCPQPPQACCFPDGTCQFVTPEECASLGGQAMGNGTVCDPNPCAQPPMACCFPDGHCEFLTADVCREMGGAPQGFGTVCEPNTCPQPTMACCFPDGHCEIQTAENCQALGGMPQGFGTNCEPNLCEQPPVTGACCLDDQGTCRVLTQAECTEANGQYQGDNTTCEPTNPCPIVPTKGTTWGQIKANYR
jgi:hypothetical protein